MKRILGQLMALLILLTACSPSEPPDAKTAQGGSGLKIVATLFPHYDFARQIAGEKADVVQLLPPGIESHTFDPSPGDIAAIYDADIFIYSGSGMEPWADRIAAGLPEGVLVVRAADGIELLREDEYAHDGEDGDHDEDDSHEHAYDPHIWLDLRNAAAMCEAIGSALERIDPDNSSYYAARVSNYTKELLTLDAEFAAMIADGRRDTLVFAGRFAYIYFLRRYGLDYLTAYDSCSAAAEPGIKRVAEIIDYVRENGVPCVYSEEFTNKKIARAISSETGASVALFSTAHNVTRDQLYSGITFIDIMLSNFESVKQGLY